jgi:hypothetical protein
MAFGSYLGRTTMGQGTPIPVDARGNLDINALLGGIVDARKTYVYDTLKIPPGGAVANTPYEFFANPVGSPDPYNGNLVKTELETNMRKPREFSPPYDMIVNNLGFLFVQGDLIFDIQQIVTLGFFEFKILEKRQWAGHLWRHPPGAGFAGGTTRWFESVWSNGIPAPSQIWHFGDYKKYIPPTVQFSLTLTFPETYGAYYNGAAGIPASVAARLGAGVPANVIALMPTLQAQNIGGNGIHLIAFMNGIGNAPVQ